MLTVHSERMNIISAYYCHQFSYRLPDTQTKSNITYKRLEKIYNWNLKTICRLQVEIKKWIYIDSRKQRVFF